MSIKRLENDISDFMEEIVEVEQYPDISRLIIPFSIAFKKFSPPDIYDGEELIPFEEKDLEFKEILIHEFLTISKNSK
ncbi:MAG: hypothetical protein ACXAEX_00525 [Promethearchaeota archaeon]|jgi:hypothetical protein